MNIHVYCDSMSVSPIQDNELQLYLYGIDKDHLKDQMTDIFTLKEVLEVYDLDVVREYLRSFEER